MAIEEADLVVLTVAMIQKYGVVDTMQLEGQYIETARDMIEKQGGHVSLVFTSDPLGSYINITCLFSEEQRKEWERMGMTNRKMGQA